ncbi:MAG: hypothetical protein H6940_03170 [Burkholderiales bacterium]|nr:hypothetical protein [Burkholderiales bacterium]
MKISDARVIRNLETIFIDFIEDVIGYLRGALSISSINTTDCGEPKSTFPKQAANFHRLQKFPDPKARQIAFPIALKCKNGRDRPVDP